MHSFCKEPGDRKLYAGFCGEHTMSEVKANISQRRKTDYDRRLIKYMREKHRMKKQGVVKSIFIGFLAVAIILSILPAQDANAAAGKWKKNKSGKYYIFSDGKKAAGSCEIKGEYFIFDMEGAYPEEKFTDRCGKSDVLRQPKRNCSQRVADD